jgi:gamma-glutamyl-gamma-aminobutyrate hydrolase PuuD
MKKKIYVVGDATYYASFINNVELVYRLEDAQYVLFTGGEDVTPALYGENAHVSTYSNLERDMKEKEIFDQMSPSQIAIGICRGSQFLCVMNGGKLIQDVRNHVIYGTHRIIDSATQKTYEITSTHHQMQYPYMLPYDWYTILMYSKAQGYRHTGLDLSDEQILHLVHCEPEVVLYTCPNKPKCLANQGHPEIMNPDAPIIKKLNEIIETL